MTRKELLLARLRAICYLEEETISDKPWARLTIPQLETVVGLLDNGGVHFFGRTDETPDGAHGHCYLLQNIVTWIHTFRRTYGNRRLPRNPNSGENLTQNQVDLLLEAARRLDPGNSENPPAAQQEQLPNQHLGPSPEDISFCDLRSERNGCGKTGLIRSPWLMDRVNEASLSLMSVHNAKIYINDILFFANRGFNLFNLGLVGSVHNYAFDPPPLPEMSASRLNRRATPLLTVLNIHRTSRIVINSIAIFFPHGFKIVRKIFSDLDLYEVIANPE